MTYIYGGPEGGGTPYIRGGVGRGLCIRYLGGVSYVNNLGILLITLSYVILSVDIFCSLE